MKTKFFFRHPLIHPCWAFALVVFFSLAAHGNAAPEQTPAEITLSPLSRTAVILALGDSLTHGNGAGLSESYPAVLQEIIDRTVINAGIPGEETKGGLARLPGLLKKHNPALLILHEGANDIMRQRPVAEIVKNLKEMIALAKEKHVEVLLVGVPDIGTSPDTASFYYDIAKQSQVPLENKAMATILSQAALKADFIHPNAEGYRVFANAIAHLLRTRGALP
ncbi:MAG: arylesterase [Magnetococcales bacterium]|nr:arylesterase [Magnetococcales bacterium]